MKENRANNPACAGKSLETREGKTSKIDEKLVGALKKVLDSTSIDKPSKRGHACKQRGQQ